ncbi:hypothetical protein Back2_09390 [Nocardioides baekrokdamisoli]|uniref:Acetyltransferase n=1 Tax=Nocardioides baekrokdamisoli TaxID=1804624 RepID=A0A3G9IE66_9ACTN|nr:hypothetical protein [Nocardioides baekrokdamisoli]BBH16652.1 hypothetical protein Back2_09390 [Nocardioides baekrokdamisoli]
MTWVLGDEPSQGVRARLLSAGVRQDVLDGLSLREVIDPLPDWWSLQRNHLFVVPDVDLPARLIETMTGIPFADSLFVVASTMEPVASLLVGGDGPVVFFGPEVNLLWGDIYCGAHSEIILNGRTTGTGRTMLDARNGGHIIAQPDQLWADNLYLATDDMHRLEDVATGDRINAFGGRITLGEHVWIARDAVVTGNVAVGDGSVIGMRSLVRNQTIPAQAAAAGTPARVIRTGVTWRGEDTP